jgi:hypothetical protein
MRIRGQLQLPVRHEQVEDLFVPGQAAARPSMQAGLIMIPARPRLSSRGPGSLHGHERSVES